MSTDKNVTAGTQKPWSEGGKEESLDRMDITMTHDELETLIGPAADAIRKAGFVIVPRKWRHRVIAVLDQPVLDQMRERQAHE
jgi:hypothetical protein